MDDFVMKKKKKSDTEEGEKDKGGVRSDNDSAETFLNLDVKGKITFQLLSWRRQPS